MRTCRAENRRILCGLSACLLFFAFFAPLQAAAQTESRPSVITADYTMTVLFKGSTRSVNEGRIYLSPPLVRLEPGEAADSGYHEFFLYDFGGRKLMRVFPENRIYFSLDLSDKSLFKAMQEGWIPWKKIDNLKQRWITLKEETIEDYTCTVDLLENVWEFRSAGGGVQRRVEYSLFWRARDLDNIPLRIAYSLPDRSIILIHYENIQVQPFSKALFEPPPEFLSLSPF